MSGRVWRVAYGRIAQETNALSGLRTEVGDFERTHLVEGEALREAVAPGGSEAPGFLKRAELSGLVREAERWGRREGDRVRVTLGGRVDPERHPPLELDARVTSRVWGLGGQRQVVLDVGSVRTIVCEGPPLAVMPSFYRQAGLRLRDADLIIAKSFFPFLLYFLPYARMYGFIRTIGVTDLDAAHAFAEGGAVHPRDEVAYWRSADRRRRGVMEGEGRS